jgi:hypothetical protein
MTDNQRKILFEMLADRGNSMDDVLTQAFVYGHLAGEEYAIEASKRESERTKLPAVGA